MDKVSITFQPVAASEANNLAGPTSLGTTDAQGRFTLNTIEKSGQRSGAVVGKHRVTFALPGEVPEGESMPGNWVLPDTCRDGSMTFDVPSSGTDKADFQLQSAAKKKPAPPKRAQPADK